MKIIVAGGTGFVGRAISERLLKSGHQVTAIGSRRPEELSGAVPRMLAEHSAFNYVAADTCRSGPWQDVLVDAEVVINLAGRTIFKRWTKDYKRVLYESRVLTTRNLVDGLDPSREVVFLSASAIGYYGAGGEVRLDEFSAAGDDFLARLALDWEAAALEARVKGARVVVMRFGVILGGAGGALAKMAPVFRLGGGGPLGNGRQWFSWIHLEDLLAAMVFLLRNQDAAGAFNFCAPQPVRNGEFAATLGRVLKRPALVPVPALALKLAMGEFGGTLLASQRVVPARLAEAGFEFRFASLDSALRDLL